MINIISPHIKDAVLSLGGLLSRLKQLSQDVCVHYIFNISDWTNPNYSAGDIYTKDKTIITQTEQAEEKVISEMLGYKSVFYDFDDLPLRDPIGGEDAEAALIDEIDSRIGNAVHKSEDIVFFPLGLENPHHRIVREIGISFLYRGYKILFYEDMPFATRYDYSAIFPLAQRHGYIPECVEINMDEKYSLMKLYRSQVSEESVRDIKNYSYSLNGNIFYERFWKPNGFDHRLGITLT